MEYTFVFEEPLDVVTFETKTIYGALKELTQYMIENKRFLCNLAPYYETPKRCFLLREVHIKIIEKELLT